MFSLLSLCRLLTIGGEFRISGTSGAAWATGIKATYLYDNILIYDEFIQAPLTSSSLADTVLYHIAIVCNITCHSNRTRKRGLSGNVTARLLSVWPCLASN